MEVLWVENDKEESAKQRLWRTFQTLGRAGATALKQNKLDGFEGQRKGREWGQDEARGVDRGPDCLRILLRVV